MANRRRDISSQSRLRSVCWHFFLLRLLRLHYASSACARSRTVATKDTKSVGSSKQMSATTDSTKKREGRFTFLVSVSQSVFLFYSMMGAKSCSGRLSMTKTTRCRFIRPTRRSVVATRPQESVMQSISAADQLIVWLG